MNEKYVVLYTENGIEKVSKYFRTFVQAEKFAKLIIKVGMTKYSEVFELEYKQ